MATNLKEFNISTMGSLINNTKEKSALVDFDMIPVMDSKDNNLIKKYSFSSLKVAINDQLSSVYTATDVLDKIKTVDGAGSGLDADLLDGLQGNQFVKRVDWYGSNRKYTNLGGMFSYSFTNVGVIVIELGTQNIMFDAKIRVWSYNHMMDIQVGAYTYTDTSAWFSPRVQGFSKIKDMTVRFTQNGSLRYILIGTPSTNWGGYVHVSVDDVNATLGTVTQEFVVYINSVDVGSLHSSHVIEGAWSGFDADTLDGLHASSFIAQGSELSVSSLLVESGAKIKLNIDYPTFSWGGDTSYPTIYGSAIDRWFMMINPHIPYVQNGVNGYAGTTMQGATIRMASDTSATYSWDLGIGVCGVGADKFAIGRNNIPFIAINNGGGVSVANDISLGLHGRIVGGGASGSWGSINIAGTKGGYGGIRFESSGLTFMVRDSDGLSGIINDAGSWKWYWDGSGILAVGTVPYARLSGMQSLSSGTGLDGSSYNAGTAITWSLTAITSGNETVGALRYSGTGANNGQMNGGSSITTSTIRLNYNGIFYAVGLRFGASGSSSYSDERLKKYIKDIENATDLIYSLKPRMYKLRAKLGGINEYHYGLIAQEVVKVLEETGIEKTAFLQYPREEDEYFGIDYTQLIAPLIATVQELNTRLKALEKGNESWN